MNIKHSNPEVLFSEMYKKEILSFEHRMKSLLRKEKSLNSIDTFQLAHIYFLGFEGNDFKKAVTDGMLLDSISASTYNVRNRLRNKEYLKTVSYVFDKNNTLFAMGDARSVFLASKYNPPDKSTEDIIELLRSPETDVVFIPGYKRFFRLGYYFVKQNKHIRIFKSSRDGLLETSIDDYIVALEKGP
jgi:hypothetical protein